MRMTSLFGDIPEGIEVITVPYHPSNAILIPLFEPIPAGLPSPAEDYIDSALDLNDLVVQHPAATFFVRVKGHSMIDAGIESGDVLVAVDPRYFRPTEIDALRVDGLEASVAMAREVLATGNGHEGPQLRDREATLLSDQGWQGETYPRPVRLKICSREEEETSSPSSAIQPELKQ